MIVTETERFFGENTPLSRAPEFGGRPYEPRPQQHAMAVSIARRLQDKENLCIEAPTGVGKTFAYLVPAILSAKATGRPVVVSTHTISLQEQILEKDLPLLSALLDTEFRAVVAKGRANYLCLRRLDALANMDQEMLPNAEVLSEFDALYAWAGRTEDGSKSELPIPISVTLWESVCCERGNCLNAKCSFPRRCFLMRNRRSLEQADIIVANHALFFTDLAMKQQVAENGMPAGLLPDYGAAILDEGHTIEDCASSHLGLRVGSFELRRTLHRLYHPERNRGLLANMNDANARNLVRDALDQAGRFFLRIIDWMAPQQKDPLRYTSPGHIPPFLDLPLSRVESEITGIAEGSDDDLAVELMAAAEAIQEQRIAMHRFFEMDLPDHVYWIERQGRTQSELTLNAVPVPISPLLSKTLFNARLPIVVTSATLAVRGNLSFFCERIGMGQPHTLILDTPFDFERQVCIHIGKSMPTPKQTDAFLTAAARQIRHFIGMTHGKAFVLFTSYSMMHILADDLLDFFVDKGIELMVQGDGLSRSRMLDAFRKDTDSVIFGTSSFWTGVDVPGEALSNVIIVKLPFAVPDHPLVAARQEDIERRGGNSFRDYSLPDAILKFRQGFGRLIRSREDKGIVVVLDSRIATTSYGRAFMDSVPICSVEVF